jgi:hypothetical protein
LKTREAAASRERIAVTPEDDDIGQVLVPDTPPRPVEESQGGTSITSATRSAKLLVELPRLVLTEPLSSIYSQKSPQPPLASTALPRLEDQGRRKREMTHTKNDLESAENGLLHEPHMGSRIELRYTQY